MRLWLPLAAGAAVLVVACNTDRPGPTAPTPPGTALSGALVDIQGVNGKAHVLLTRLGVPRGFQRHRKPPPSGTGIFYHGGPIIYSQKVAALYWSTSTIYAGGPTPGTNGAGSADGSLVGFFLSNLGGSPYYNINTTYFDGTGTHVGNAIAYTQFWADNASPGAAPSDAQIQAEVIAGFTSGNLTFDPSTLYLVFTGPGVNLGGGFGSRYCAYHGHFSWNGNDVKYAAEPHDYDFPTACAALSGSPNNDFAADAEVNTVAHETEETNTDEDLNAWFDNVGNENADKCAWQFGTTFQAPNGATANQTIGGRAWLIQMNWVNATNSSGGAIGCRQQWP